MLDSTSTKDIESIVGQFTSNIMETYIDEAQMTDLDEFIQSDNSLLSNFLEKECTKNDIDGLDESIHSKDDELSLDYESVLDICQYSCTSN